MQAQGIHMRRRIYALFLFFLLILGLLTGRLGYIQIARGEELSQMSLGVRLRRVPLQPERGDIVDRRGKLLAGNVTAMSVYAFPPEVEDHARTAERLAGVLGLDAARLERVLRQRSYFQWVARKVTDAQAEAVRALGLPGIGLVPEVRRYYPEGSLAAHVLGIVGIDHVGLEGIEYSFERYLRGEPGSIQVEFDARGYEIAGGVRRHLPAEQGYTLVLSIDSVIQHIVERDLEKAVAQTGAKGAAIALMDIRTGDILAMGMYPSFDPNRYQDFPDQNRRNWAVADAVHPGSIFKPITAAAALEDRVITPESPVHDAGCISLAGYTICNYNHRGFGAGTVADVLKQSSNVGTMQIAMELGVDRFFDYLFAFGFGHKTGIELAGEATGLYPNPATATQLDLAVMSFGQTLTVTPIQMLAAIGAIANDGRLMRPRLVRELRTTDGEVIERFEPQMVRQVISPETAMEVKSLLEQVVMHGTGRNAFVPGYRLGGKTGTSEKVQGSQGQGEYIASFVGFGPVEDPRVAVLVMIDEPQGIIYGGQIAAPVFSHIMNDVMRYLEIPPSLPVEGQENQNKNGQREEAMVPSLVNLPIEQAVAEAGRAGFTLNIAGSGPLVVDQTPPAGVALTVGSTIAVQAGGTLSGTAAGDSLVRVPLLQGMGVRQAGEVLARMGLLLQAEGSGLAVDQEPAAGTLVSGGSRVRVIFRQP